MSESNEKEKMSESLKSSKVRLGYVAINITLADKGIFTNRTVRQITLENSGDPGSICRELAMKNIADLFTIIKWNEEKGIRFFRITSTLFPHMGNRTLVSKFPNERYFKGDIAFAKKLLGEIGEFALQRNHRLTFHTQPYIQLGTPNPIVWKASLFELAMHAKILGYLGISIPSVIVHVGGVYDSKERTIERWIARFQKLPASIRGILILENDEWHYGAQTVLDICTRIGIPMCFDYYHNTISNNPVTVTPAFLETVCGTWHGLRPKFHLSDKGKGRKGTHAQYVKEIPAEFVKLSKKIGIDIMIEAKMKEKALFRLLRLI